MSSSKINYNSNIGNENHIIKKPSNYINNNSINNIDMKNNNIKKLKNIIVINEEDNK